MDTVTQIASGDALFCPVRAWAAIAHRIWGYKGASEDTPVSAVWRWPHQAHHLLFVCCPGCGSRIAVGYEKLGIKKGEIGTHSLRSEAAMAM